MGQWADEYWNDRHFAGLADDIIVGVGATAAGKDASLVTDGDAVYENTAAPSVVGTAQVGKQLFVEAGTWPPWVTAVALPVAGRWCRDRRRHCGDAGGDRALGGQADQVVRVTASGAAGNPGVATSAATVPVVAAPAPEPSPPPRPLRPPPRPPPRPTPTPTPTATPTPTPAPTPTRRRSRHRAWRRS